MAELNARIIAKASATAGEEPVAGDLEVAELAVNTADGKLFTKHTDNSIVTISGGGGAVDSVNGQTGVVSLSLDNLSDVIDIATPDFRYATVGNIPTGGFNFNGGYFQFSPTDSDGRAMALSDWPQGTSGTVMISTNGDPFLEVPYNNLVDAGTFFQIRYDDSTYVFVKAAPCIVSFTSPYLGPTDGQVLTWVEANNQWEPAAGGGGATSIDNLTDVDTSTVAPTDGQVLTWVDVNGRWESRAVQLPDAAATRTLLGIGEYVDDAAAGTGGVASGAMYYNTTSSDYRLKT